MEGKTVTGDARQRKAEKCKNGLRKQSDDAKSASHNKRNLRSKTKQFAIDEWELLSKVVPILVLYELHELRRNTRNASGYQDYRI